MFRYTKLILAVILTGCVTQAGEQVDIPEIFIPPPLVQPNNNLLETIEATLDVADEAIDEIIKDKIKSRNEISNLQNTVDYEENLLQSISGELGAKDSLIYVYQENNLILEEKIYEVEDNLNHALHKCETGCYPTIMRLNQENQDLLYSIDSLQTWVFYLDSLVLTNKRLSKKNVFPH
jgi:hypothetical protein